MKIEDSDIKLIQEWLSSHWKGEPLCPVCQNNNWLIGKTIAELRPFLKGKLSTGSHVYPAVTISCNVCGHTLFFNAIQLGIVKLPPPPPPKEGDGVVTPPKDVILPVAPPDKVAPPPPPPSSKQKEGDDNG